MLGNQYITDEQVKAIKDLRNKIKESCKIGKVDFEKIWFRNIIFFNGNQWIVYDRSKRQWSQASLSDVPGWIPRPVTNKFSEAALAIKSLLVQQEPTIVVSPARADDDASVASAKIGEYVMESIDEESGMQNAKKIASTWVVLCGNGFFYTYYYTSPDLGNIQVDFEQCQNPACGQSFMPDEIQNDKCPVCGQTDAGFGKQLDPATAMPMGQQFPKGKICTDAVSPFEMYYNHEIENFKDIKEFVMTRLKPVDELQKLYPDLKDSIVADQGSQNLGDQYQKAIAYITDIGMSQGYKGNSGAVKTTPVDYVHSMPCEDFPDGLYAVLIADNIVESGPLPSVNSEGKKFLPVAHAGCNRVPGRSIHKTRMDDVAQKQIQRNKYESLIEIHMKTMASGRIMVPDGANMDKPTGRPSQLLKYTFIAGQPEPKFIPGTPLNETFLNLIQQIDKEIESATASFDVLKGQHPAGVKTYSEIALLTERVVSVHGEMVENWEDALQEVKKQQLWIAQKNFTEPRQKTFKNEFGGWETKQFTKADIQGGMDVKIEKGSTVPRSRLADNMAIKESIGDGLINIQDPMVNFKVLERRGQSDLAAGISKNIQDAAKEWHDFSQAVEDNPTQSQAWQMALRPRKGIDDETAHYADSSSRCKSEEFWKLPAQAQSMWVEHTIYHKNNLEMQAMAMQGGMGAPGSPGPRPTMPSPGPAMPNLPGGMPDNGVPLPRAPMGAR